MCATRLYLRTASNSLTGTFPTGEQSASTPVLTWTGAATLRQLSTVKGSAQTSQAQASGTTAAHLDFIRFFCSQPLKGAQTVGGGQVILNIAAAEANLAENFIVNRLEVYVWRPSTGAKVGTVLTAATAPNTPATEMTSTGSEQVDHNIWNSSSAVSAADQDVVIAEVWANYTKSTTSRSLTVYYDGTTENTTENAVVSNHAAFVQLAETLTFGLKVDMAAAGTVSAVGAAVAQSIANMAAAGGAVGAAGTGVLGAIVPAVAAGALSVTGAGVLSSVTVTYADMTGTGAAGVSGSAAITVVIPLSATGALAAASSAAMQQVIPMQGARTVTASGAGTLSALSDMTGTGSASAAGGGPLAGLMPLAGTGAVSVAGNSGADAVVPLGGAGALSGAGSGTLDAVVNADGVGLVAVDGTAQPDEIVALDGVGAIDVESHGQDDLGTPRVDLAGVGTETVAGSGKLRGGIMAITMITLSGAELDEQGNPLSGYITFTLSAALIDAADDYTLSPAVVTVATNPADGTWSTVLAATKGDAGITPTGVTYTVTKRLGSHTERFSIELDAAGGATQDLADITPSTNIVTATYDAAGAAALVQAHLDTHAAASDPHPVYLTAAEGAALPFDAAGAASTVQGNLTTHGTLTTTAHGGLVASTDARLTDARTPTVHHTTHNTGQSDAIAPGDIGAATAGALTTHTGLTTTAHGGLVASNDSRLTDARTPTAHATTHETGGSDPVYANLGSDSTARVESILRWIAGGSAVLVTQGATFAYFTPRINLTISNLLVAGNSNATSVTLVRMGLYTAAGNGDLTLVARCAADATLLATAGTIYTRVLDTTGGYPASYALVRGTRYAFGIVAVFTGTAPQVRSVLGSGQLFALDPIQTLFKAGQADLPTSQTFASGAITGNLIWMAAT